MVLVIFLRTTEVSGREPAAGSRYTRPHCWGFFISKGSYQKHQTCSDCDDNALEEWQKNEDDAALRIEVSNEGFNEDV